MLKPGDRAPDLTLTDLDGRAVPLSGLRADRRLLWLIFLRHPDMVSLVRELGDHESLADALTSCEIDESRWPAFDRAVTALVESEVVHVRG